VVIGSGGDIGIITIGGTSVDGGSIGGTCRSGGINMQIMSCISISW